MTPAMTNPLRDPDIIGFAGDWHGDTNYAVRQIKRLAGEGVKTILHAGDFAYNFDPTFLDKLNKALYDADVILLWVEGNHENFDKLYGNYKIDSEVGLRRIRNNIWHIPRGFRWTWWGSVAFMGLGGAVSVDRDYRIPGASWWPQETLTIEDVDNALVDQTPIDVFISHDVPYEASIPGIRTEGENDSGFPTHSIMAAREHRKALSLVTNALEPWLIVHGHYHLRYDTIMTYPSGRQAQVVGLDCNENAPKLNAVTMRSEDIMLAAAFHKELRESNA